MDESAERVISDVYRKIEREKVIIQGARSVRQSTSNASVQARCDTQIREAQKNISYLEDTMRQLKLRSKPTPEPPKGGSGQSSTEITTPGPKPGPRPNFARLDLLKYDSTYLGPRIQLMLQQLEFKLSVEEQYKEGIDKMLKLYKLEGDRRSKAEAEEKRMESIQKIQLLKKSLKRYSDMHIDIEEDLGDDSESMAASNIRRPLTGNLHIACYGIKDADHVSSGRLGRAPETFISVKVEDQTRAKTRGSRNDRWLEEFDLNVDKANEVEIVVYDRTQDRNVPIGMMWLRISDIAEALRRKRVEAELHNEGWVSAAKVQQTANPDSGPYGHTRDPSSDYYQHMYQGDGSHQHSGGTPLGGSGAGGGAGTGGSSGAGGPQDSPLIGNGSDKQVIDSWFVLEPAGQIHLALGFEKSNRGVKRAYDGVGGLGRQGAIRQKKEEVHEVHGHKFAPHQFYNIMRCALCGDFLKYSGGYQCMDCKYTCHKKCYPKVVTKCISKASTELDPDEEKLNHRIPHRFEPATNMSANWCCHCGSILPLGKKTMRKCTECGVTSHAQCVHLVPDFCGMSMEMANNILRTIRDTKYRQQHRAPGSAPSMASSSTTLTGSTLTAPQQQQQGQIAAAGGNVGYSPYQQPTHGPPSAHGAGGGMYAPPPPPPKKEPIRRKEVGSSGPTVPIPSSSSSTYTANTPTSSFTMESTTPVSPDSVTKSAYAESPTSHSVAAAAAAAGVAGYDQGAPPVPQHHQPQPQQQPPQQLQQQQPPQQQYPSQNRLSYDEANQAASAAAAAMAKGHDTSVGYGDSHAHATAPQTGHRKEPSIDQAIDHKQQPAQAQAVQKQATQPSESPRRKAKKKVGLDDFNFLAVLGKGNFGKVMLAESKQLRKLYAIKVLKKDFIIEHDEVESTRSEKRVFLVANRERHPFLLNLYSCFQTENRVYFVMEYVSGGDLMWHIQKMLFTPRRAQFYAAEVLLALKYFHDNGVIYRDLKLDNILLTLEGHIKIADYGLCKEDMWYGKTTGTFCGTPEFMAPEILHEQRYGRAVDWWAFGVLLYQMLLGKSPFRGEDEDEVFDAILNDEPLYPIHMPRDSVSILQQLLTRDPEKRLGSGPRDAEEIMAHPYFRNINFDDIYHCRVAPPFIPKIDSPTDVRHFDQEFTSEVPALTPVTTTLTPMMQEQFRGFSYLNGDAI